VVNATRFDVATLQTFTADLEDLSRDRALAVVDDALDHGATLEAVVNGLLAPALVDLGRRWAAAEMGAAEVQAASAIARVALLRAGHPLPPSDLPRVAVCCPEGEAHQIPAEMVVEVLRSRGWPAELAGHGVSGDELRTYLGGRPPAALLVSCTMPSRLAGVARAIDAAHEVGVPTMVGGAGLGRDDTRALRLGAAA
jgi:methanogenic corrinoid protein MtbC1